MNLAVAIYQFRRWLSRVIASAPRVIDLAQRMRIERPDYRYDPKQHRRR